PPEAASRPPPDLSAACRLQCVADCFSQPAVRALGHFFQLKVPTPARVLPLWSHPFSPAVLPLPASEEPKCKSNTICDASMGASMTQTKRLRPATVTPAAARSAPCACCRTPAPSRPGLLRRQ